MTRHGPVERLAVQLWLGGEEVPVGTLAWSLRDRLAAFEYDAGFITRGLRLSPFALPLKAGVVMAPRVPFEGLHGLFADSLPDGWGRLLVDRKVKAAGGDPASLSPLDRLSLVGGSGMGALTYRPERYGLRKAGEVDLETMAKQAMAVLEGHLDVDIDKLADANGGSAGARPKTMIMRNRETGEIRLDVGQPPRRSEEAWIVKFRSREDPNDAGRLEHAYALMARSAGIDFPETCVLGAGSGTGFFAARRFDRTPDGRHHVQTLAALVGADHRIPSLDYGDFLKVTRMLTGEAAQTEEAYRRMVFNVLAGNRDDHAKNHAYRMARDGTWRLTPAYDVSNATGPGGEHAMAIAGEGRSPTMKDLRIVAETASISKGSMDEINEKVIAAIRTWPSHAQAAGVRNQAAESLATTLKRNVERMSAGTLSAGKSSGKRPPDSSGTIKDKSKGSDSAPDRSFKLLVTKDELSVALAQIRSQDTVKASSKQRSSLGQTTNAVVELLVAAGESIHVQSFRKERTGAVPDKWLKGAQALEYIQNGFGRGRYRTFTIQLEDEVSTARGGPTEKLPRLIDAAKSATANRQIRRVVKPELTTRDTGRSRR